MRDLNFVEHCTLLLSEEDIKSFPIVIQLDIAEAYRQADRMWRFFTALGLQVSIHTNNETGGFFLWLELPPE